VSDRVYRRLSAA